MRIARRLRWHLAARTTHTLRLRGAFTNFGRFSRSFCTAERKDNEYGKSLRVFNSLTGRMEPFSVRRQTSSQNTCGNGDGTKSDSDCPVRWYSCGPTVYDSAHLGHARAYVSLDIIHRLMRDMFGFDMMFALGMTDVDDKIITRAEQEQCDPRQLARRFEDEFLEDLEELNVLPPCVILRVSEHIDDIIKYISTIKEAGCAYQSGGDVYFDVLEFNKHRASEYGKMGPPSAHMVDGELTDANNNLQGTHTAVKRDARDFALWKASKGEPASVSWPSPWGPGRPGWHIECSALSHAALGPYLDLHTGGIDLKFPHHCNEIAQSEAYNHHCADGNCTASPEWVNYFMHCGHLHIEGRKMSKSLKNFISVREFLDENCADSFRVFCLLHRYRSNITYSPDRIEDAKAVMLRLDNFFHDVQHFLAVHRSPTAEVEVLKRWQQPELELQDTFNGHRSGIRHALASDFDTPLAMKHLLDLTRAVSGFVTQQQHGGGLELVDGIQDYVSSLLSICGLRRWKVGATERAEASDQSLEALLEVRTGQDSVTRRLGGHYVYISN